MSNKIDAGQRYWDLMGIKAQWGANSGGAAPSPAQQQAAAPAPKTGGKKLTDPNIAKQYIAKAGGDKAKARQLAQQDGWSF
jgi:nitrous oxide reductase accessory protein NosL